MDEAVISCPKCGEEIKLTQSLAAPMVAAVRKEYAEKAAAAEETVRTREAAVEAERARLKEEAARLGEKLSVAVAAEREKLAAELTAHKAKVTAEEAKKANAACADEMAAQARQMEEMRQRDREREVKLAEAQKAQAALLGKERELEETRREMGLEIEKGITAAIATERASARKQADAELATKLAEKDAALLESEETGKKLALAAAARAKAVASRELEQKAGELAELQVVMKQKEEKLAEAQKAEASLRKKERELEDARREMDLNIEKRVSESVEAVRVTAKKEAEDGLTLKLREKDIQLESMRKTVDDLKRKAEQGSQQLQGEALEVHLESMLREKFPFDVVEPVAKGVLGADILQRVVLPTGVGCGSILWEAKQTKTWGGTWIPKLRENQREQKADVAVLVSAVLPRDVETFAEVEGVWVVHPQAAIPLACCLRQLLTDVHCARQATAGQQTKMGMVYEYVTGPAFGHRVKAIMQAFATMQKDLIAEKNAIGRLWSKREKQLEIMVSAGQGLAGDIQAIVGQTLQDLGEGDIRLLGQSVESADES